MIRPQFSAVLLLALMIYRFHGLKSLIITVLAIFLMIYFILVMDFSDLLINRGVIPEARQIFDGRFSQLTDLPLALILSDIIYLPFFDEFTFKTSFIFLYFLSIRFIYLFYLFHMFGNNLYKFLSIFFFHIFCLLTLIPVSVLNAGGAIRYSSIILIAELILAYACREKTMKADFFSKNMSRCKNGRQSLKES